MYRNLFIAWYCLGVLVLCATAFLIALPFIGAERAMGGFGFLGLLGFVPAFRYFVFRGEKQDERDILFWKQAALTGFSFGFSAIFCLFGLQAIVYQYMFLSGDGSAIPRDLWQGPVLCGLLVFIFSFSVEMIRLYRKDKHTEHGGQTNE